MEEILRDERITVRKGGAPASDGRCVVYWMQRAQRATDNPRWSCNQVGNNSASPWWFSCSCTVLSREPTLRQVTASWRKAYLTLRQIWPGGMWDLYCALILTTPAQVLSVKSGACNGDRR